MTTEREEAPWSTRANDGEVLVQAAYGSAGDAALDRWAAARSATGPPFRPRFMVYSGLGSPEMTGRRLRLLQEVGAESFLIAADLPSQLGFDPDHELAHAQVGRAGVSCATLDDLRTMVAPLDLDRADSLGLLANSVGHIGLGMVHAVLEDRVAPHVRLVMQNDPLKEYTARGTEIFEPRQSVRIACDAVAHAIDHRLPGAAMTVCSNHYDVAGAGPVLGVALAFANAVVYVDELVGRGYDPVAVADKLMFFLNERSDLYVQAALFRTARVLWADLLRERYGVADADQPVAVLMGYAHGLESADEPLVNIPRVTLSVLGSMVGGVDYLCATGYDEALRIPSADAAALAVRTMQVVAHEHGASATHDPFRGSLKSSDLEDQIATTVRAEMARLDDEGGGLAALESGYIASRIDDHRGTRERQLATGRRAMVGRSVAPAPQHRGLFGGSSAGEVDFAAVESEARARVLAQRARRHAPDIDRALGAVKNAAAGTDNLVPPTMVALRAGATTQEIVEATHRGFS